MLVYISMIIWCLFWGHFLDHKFSHKNIREKKLVCMLPFLAVFIVSAIRYNVGVDYSGTYTNTYLRLLSGDVDERVEPLIMLIYKMIVLFDANLQWFFVITSFLVCYFVDKSIKQQSIYIKLSYFIFICGTFLFYSYNGTRQAIGMAFFYFSLIYLMKDEQNCKWYKLDSTKYFAINIIGVLNHLSSAIFLPLFFLIKRKIPAWIKGVVIAGLAVANVYVVPYIVNILFYTKFRAYLYEGAYAVEERMNLSMLLNLFILLIYEFVLRKKNNYTEKDIIYDNIHFYGAIISVFSTSIPLALRMFMSFRYIEFLSVPNLISHANKKYRKLIVIGVYVFYFIYFVYMVGVRNGNEVLPYQTFFF